MNELIKSQIIINNWSWIYLLLKNDFKNLKIEHLWIVLLDRNGVLIEKRLIAKETENEVKFSSKEIFKYILNTKNIGRFFIAHNHPNGFPDPSLEDWKVHKKLHDICENSEIMFIDHLVFSEKFCFSMKYKRKLTPQELKKGTHITQLKQTDIDTNPLIKK